MGYIIEPKGVDLIVAPSVLTVEDTKSIRSAISEYRRTGTNQVTINAVVEEVARKTKVIPALRSKGKITQNKKLATKK